jgi:uncharacterized protein (TIGR02001 family)
MSPAAASQCVARLGGRKRAGLPLLVLSCLANAAYGDSAWEASVAATSDYVYRGISQTEGHGAAQLGASYSSPLGWFAGAWASNVDPYPGKRSYAELDVYAGAVHALSDSYALRATFTHYGYLGESHASLYDRNEAALSVTYLDLLSATVAYSPDQSSYSALGFTRRRASLAYELAGRWPLGFGIAASAGAGYYDLHDLFHTGYWAGNVGVSYAYRQLTFDLDRFITGSAATRLYEEASANGVWVLSAVFHF